MSRELHLQQHCSVQNQFFGLVFAKEGGMPRNVSTTKKASEPKIYEEVLPFIIMAKALALDFIPEFAKLAAPIYELTRINVKLFWSEESRNCFNEINSKLTEEKIKASFDHGSYTHC